LPNGAQTGTLVFRLDLLTAVFYEYRSLTASQEVPEREFVISTTGRNLSVSNGWRFKIRFTRNDMELGLFALAPIFAAKRR
jgi:hypothetical protein